ncbi:Zinc carboxypeptidase [Salipaludibacillus aurantiacus]|uniref:Zinc carboxypeptidase n=2 Tax=Salipaludibacillus aurantiacus TaxID=1601833 RepID=A0A1H9XAK7_9BACI|nr:Zinc carboxypeptidase [Salipaludibacillus aurantiacus]
MRRMFSLFLALVMVMSVSMTVFANPQSKPNGPWIQPEQEVKLESLMSPEDLEKNLMQIKDRARPDRMELDVVGYSATYEYPIYAVKFGEADTDNPKIFIQTQIHGDEQLGTEASMDLIQQLAMSNNKDITNILDNVTVWFIPMLNPDGAVIFETEQGQSKQRQNLQVWDPAEYGLAEDTQAPWYYRPDSVSREMGFDVNRDFHPYLDFELGPDTAAYIPRRSSEPGVYATPEALASRAVFKELQPDLFIDHHHRYSNIVSEDDDRLNTLQIIAQVVDEDTVVSFGGTDYQLDEESLNLSKQVNSHVYQALQRGNSPFGAVSRYPEVNLPGTALGSYSMNGAAIMLYETRGQQHPYGHTGQKANGQYTQQSYVGLYETLRGFATGEIYEIDPAFYDEEIPYGSPRIGRPN